MALTQLKTGAIADDAVTTDKLANAINTERTANTAKVQTTINTNADNRVLTGTGTANTIQGESQLLFDSSGLLYIKAPDGGNRYFFGETGDSASAQFSLYNSSDEQKVRIAAGDGGNAGDTFFTGGNVGIGTNTPTASSTGYNNALLHLHQTGSSSAGSQVKFTTGASGAAAGDGTLLAQWSDNNFYINNQESGNIQFYTGGASRARIDSDGLKFGSDSAAANALDDYEEGTWTPHIDGWDTYTPYSGSSYHYNWYVKVGKLVHIGWKLYIQNLTTVSSDAHIRMTGVPFAHDSSGAGPIGHMRFDIPEFGMSGYPMVYLGGGGTTIYMYKHVNGGNNLVAMNAAANRSNVWCMGTATYATS